MKVTIFLEQTSYVPVQHKLRKRIAEGGNTKHEVLIISTYLMLYYLSMHHRSL